MYYIASARVSPREIGQTCMCAREGGRLEDSLQEANAHDLLRACHDCAMP